jgi:hypothetical protein
MTCRQCGKSFCWLCRSTWRSGCKNRLCRPNEWLDRKLGCSSPFIKPPVVLVATPIALGLGGAVGGLVVAAACVGATLAVPFFMVRIPYKKWKDVQLKRERERALARYTARTNAQMGLGITFVGASESFANHVHYGMSGRTVEVRTGGGRSKGGAKEELTEN